MTDKVFKAKQFRRAIQLWAQTLTDESMMMEIADIYPKWNGNDKSYKTGDIVSYGVNDNDETQLYIVLLNHVSQLDWTPDVAASLYKKVGFTDDGVPIWTQPLGASDSYMKNDKATHNGKTWISDVDNNVWEPGLYGWSEVTE